MGRPLYTTNAVCDALLALLTTIALRRSAALVFHLPRISLIDAVFALAAVWFKARAIAKATLLGVADGNERLTSFTACLVSITIMPCVTFCFQKTVAWFAQAT